MPPPRQHLSFLFFVSPITSPLLVSTSRLLCPRTPLAPRFPLATFAGRRVGGIRVRDLESRGGVVARVYAPPRRRWVDALHPLGSGRGEVPPQGIRHGHAQGLGCCSCCCFCGWEYRQTRKMDVSSTELPEHSCDRLRQVRQGGALERCLVVDRSGGGAVVSFESSLIYVQHPIRAFCCVIFIILELPALNTIQAYVETIALTQPGVRRICLIAKAGLLGMYASAGFSLKGLSPVVHGKDPWFEMRTELDSTEPRLLRFVQVRDNQTDRRRHR